MVSRDVVIKNADGLHLRPAGALCNEALRFHAKTTFEIGTYHGNLKSVLSVLAGGVKKNDTIRVICEGEDEQEALDRLVYVIEEVLETVPMKV